MLTNKENQPPSGLLAKHHKLIASYVGDDPLQPWLSCYKALEEAKAPKEELISVLARVFQTFRASARYSDDPRFLRLCVQLAELRAEPELFEELERCGVGGTQALFYRAWALMLEHRGAAAQAQQVLERGLARGAEPAKLRAALEELRARHAALALPLTARTQPRAPQPQPAAAPERPFSVFVDQQQPAPAPTPSRAPAPSSSAQQDPATGSRAPEKPGYSRALTTGAGGQDVSFEERRAAARPPPRKALQAAASSVGGGMRAASAPLLPAAGHGAMEDSEESEPESDPNATSAGLQTGMMTMNSLLAMRAVADWWHDPIDLHKKPGLAPPAPDQPVAPAPAPTPAAATPSAAGPRAQPLQVYVDPPAAPVAPAQGEALDQAWLERQVSRAEVQEDLEGLAHYYAGAGPAVGKGTVLETERSLIELKEQLGALVWKAEEVEKDDAAPDSALGAAVVRCSGPTGSVERLMWYAHVAALLARHPQAPRHLLRPRALLCYERRAFLVLPLCDQPTLAEVAAFYRARQRALDEVLALYYASEMLARLEELHRCGVLHGGADRLGHWQLVFEPVERFEAWRPGGWDHKGVRLLDLGGAVHLAATPGPFAAPAGHPLAALLPPQWSFHLDLLSLALALHQLLHACPLQVAPHAGTGPYKLQPPPGARRLESGVWAELFDALLNVKHRLPSLGSLRAAVDDYLAAQPQKARQIKSLILKQKVELHEAAEQAAAAAAAAASGEQ